MGDRPARSQRLTWRGTAFFLAGVSAGCIISSVTLVSGRLASPWALTLAVLATAAATLARWAELRHKTTLARRLADATDQAVDVMIRVSNGTVPPKEAERYISDAMARVARFREQEKIPRRG